MEMIFLNQVKAIAITEADLDRIYEICLSNPDYYRHMNEELSKEKLKKLMIALPPEADLKHKRNIGFILDEMLIGYLEMVESYPDEKTALIGFFVLDASLQGKGTGSLIINNISVHDKFHRTLILSGFCLLKIAKISLNSSFFPKPIKR